MIKFCPCHGGAIEIIKHDFLHCLLYAITHLWLIIPHLHKVPIYVPVLLSDTCDSITYFSS